VIGSKVLPIDYALAIIEILFVIGEVVLSIKTMIYVTKKQAAVYYLRNTQTSLNMKEEIIKSSMEIEQELFFLFPHLKSEQDGGREKTD
jgi:hypothetical protein